MQRTKLYMATLHNAVIYKLCCVFVAFRRCLSCFIVVKNNHATTCPECASALRCRVAKQQNNHATTCPECASALRCRVAKQQNNHATTCPECACALRCRVAKQQNNHATTCPECACALRCGVAKQQNNQPRICMCIEMWSSKATSPAAASKDRSCTKTKEHLVQLNS